jgi:hypothetical protein
VERKGRLASALFALLSLGGICVLFSQAEPRPSRAPAQGRRWTSLDPVPDEAMSELVPAALQRGAVIQTQDRKDPAQTTPATLRLR